MAVSYSIFLVNHKLGQNHNETLVTENNGKEKLKISVNQQNMVDDKKNVTTYWQKDDQKIITVRLKLILYLNQ